MRGPLPPPWNMTKTSLKHDKSRLLLASPPSRYLPVCEARQVLQLHSKVRSYPDAVRFFRHQIVQLCHVSLQNTSKVTQTCKELSEAPSESRPIFFVDLA